MDSFKNWFMCTITTGCKRCTRLLHSKSQIARHRKIYAMHPIPGKCWTNSDFIWAKKMLKRNKSLSGGIVV